jgi:hypothetical protein
MKWPFASQKSPQTEQQPAVPPETVEKIKKRLASLTDAELRDLQDHIQQELRRAIPYK